MKVLVVGGGGREHALAWKIKQSPLLTKLYCCPGNAGTRDIATNLDLNPSRTTALALWAVEEEIDLTVVGPEAHLAEGLVDVFTEHGLKVFGPTKQAARMEASKSFSKEIMLKAGVPTPEGVVFDDYEKAEKYVRDRGAPIVIKADGLAAGKGVVVAQSLEVALSTLKSFMVEAKHGDSGKRVVVEECIKGREASVMALVDGDTVLPLVVSQDYKRLCEKDEGPNTGGMGAISPTTVLNDMRVENLVGEVFIPVLGELALRGVNYVGFLYAGVIIDSAGRLRVLEFNCRLGDPEAQALLPRLKSDLLEAMNAGVNNRLASIELEWTPQASATVVAASRGYPGQVDDGKVIEGLFDETEDTVIFHAGTRLDPDNAGQVLTKGGRILAVSALGDNVGHALNRAYRGMSRISFDGIHYRKDIGGGSRA